MKNYSVDTIIISFIRERYNKIITSDESILNYLNSVQYIELLMGLEKIFQIEFPDDYLEYHDMETIKNISNCIANIKEYYNS